MQMLLLLSQCIAVQRAFYHIGSQLQNPHTAPNMATQPGSNACHRKEQLMKMLTEIKHLIISGYQPDTWKQLGGLYKCRGLRPLLIYASDSCMSPGDVFSATELTSQGGCGIRSECRGCGRLQRTLRLQSPTPYFLLQ